MIQFTAPGISVWICLWLQAFAAICVLSTASEAFAQAGRTISGAYNPHFHFAGYPSAFHSSYYSGFPGGFTSGYYRNGPPGFLSTYRSSVNYPFFIFADKFSAVPWNDGFRAAYLTGVWSNPQDNPWFRHVASQNPSQSTRTAHITVVVPDNASVWLDETKMESIGPVREYRSPALTPRRQYHYRIRVEWTEGDRNRTQSQSVAVGAGARVTVRFPLSAGPATARQRPATKVNFAKPFGGPSSPRSQASNLDPKSLR